MKNLVLSIMLYGVFLRTGYFGDEVPDAGARIRVMVVLHRLLEIQAGRKAKLHECTWSRCRIHATHVN